MSSCILHFALVAEMQALCPWGLCVVFVVLLIWPGVIVHLASADVAFPLGFASSCFMYHAWRGVEATKVYYCYERTFSMGAIEVATIMLLEARAALRNHIPGKW